MEELRTTVFLSLVSALFTLVLLHLGASSRETQAHRRRVIVGVGAAIATLLILVIGLPPARSALGFALPSSTAWLLVLTAAVALGAGGPGLARIVAFVQSRSAASEVQS